MQSLLKPQEIQEITNAIVKLQSKVTKPPFLVGKKQLRLPNFAVVLRRTRHLGPKYAKFEVPLWFSKLDLRDYLYHAYNVRILSARSYVKQSPVQFGKPLGPKGDAAEIDLPRWHRPTSLKFMTVELERPFVWPETPEDTSPWQQKMHLAQQKVTKDRQWAEGTLKDTYIDKENRKALKEQYEAIMNGTRTWEPPSSPNVGPILTR